MAVAKQFATAASGSTTNPQTCAFTNNTVNPSMIYVVSISTVDTESITGITDTHTNSYSQVFDVDAGNFRFELWKASNTTVGANTVSVTYDAVTNASKRVYIIEVAGMGTPTNGQSATNDVTVNENPLTLAPLNITDNQYGIAFTVVRTDNNYIIIAYVDPNIVWTDMGGSVTARAAFCILGPGVTTLAPTMSITAPNTGESATFSMYDQDQGGGGGGEHSAVF